MTDDGYAYNDAGWIVIRDWEEHNPGHTRSYSWIQVKKRLLRHPQYLELTYAQRGILLGLWIMTGELGLGRVPARPKDVARLMPGGSDADAKYLRRHLVSLNQAGWFTIDACKMHAQKEREKKKGSYEPKKESAREHAAENGGTHAPDEDDGFLLPLPPEWQNVLKEMQEEEERYAGGA